MNSSLPTKLRHLRLSGMVEALPARLAQAEAGSLSFLEFLAPHTNLCTVLGSVSLPRQCRRANLKTSAVR